MTDKQDIILVSLDSNFYNQDRIAEVGLASLEAYLRHHGISCTVVNSDAVEQYLDKSDVFGLSVLDHTYHAAQKLTQHLKGKTIIWGGPTATALPETLLAENPGIDYIILHEGEKRLLTLLRSRTDHTLFEKIDGIAFRGKDQQIVTRPPTEFVDMNELPQSGLLATHNRLVYIELSRGCYGGCRYCQETGHMRFKSAEKTLAEIRHWHSIGYRHFYIGNANSMANRDLLRDIVVGIEKMDLSINIILVGRPNDIVRNTDILEHLFRSKLVHLQGIELGIEANTTHALALLGRTSTPDINKKAIEFLIQTRDTYSPSSAIFANIILFPHYDMSIEDLVANIRFIGDYNCSRDVMVLKIVGLSNTAIWREMKARGFQENKLFGSRIAEYAFSDETVDRLYIKLIQEPMEELTRNAGVSSRIFQNFRDRCYDTIIDFYNSPDIMASLMRCIDS